MNKKAPMPSQLSSLQQRHSAYSEALPDITAQCPSTEGSRLSENCTTSEMPRPGGNRLQHRGMNDSEMQAVF